MESHQNSKYNNKLDTIKPIVQQHCLILISVGGILGIMEIINPASSVAWSLPE